MDTNFSFSCSLPLEVGGGVFKLLNAFNHLDFIEAVDTEDILRSTPELPPSPVSILAENSSFCNDGNYQIYYDILARQIFWSPQMLFHSTAIEER